MLLSVNDAFEGKYVSAAFGAIAVVPWGKAAEVVAARIVFSDGSKILISAEAVRAIRTMSEGEQALLEAEVGRRQVGRRGEHRP